MSFRWDRLPRSTFDRSMTLRIAHLPDLHFGHSHLSKRTPDGSQNQREADFSRANLAIARYLAELPIAKRPQLAIGPGDMFDATRISTPALLGARRFCRILTEAGIELVVIGGNHDQVESPIPPMLEVLREDGADIYLQQATIERQGVRLHLVPFRTIARAGKAGSYYEEFDLSDKLPNVLVAHASVEGYNFREDPVEIESWWVEDGSFDFCLLGHIHDRQQLGETNAFFSGASERAHFGERKQVPGFYLHTLDGKGKLTETAEITLAEIATALGEQHLPRPMLELRLDSEGKTLEEVDAEVRKWIAGTDVTEAMAKIVVTNVPAVFSRSHLRADWRVAFADAGGFDIDVQALTRRVGELTDVEFAAPPVDLAEAFAVFLGEQDFPSDVERDAMAGLGASVLASAREKLSALEAAG